MKTTAILKLTCGILFSMLCNSSYTQNNKTSEEFGLSIYKSILNNDFESLSNHFPILNDTIVITDKNNNVKKLVITDEILIEIKNKFRMHFYDIHNEIVKLMQTQKKDTSHLILKKIKTEIDVRNNYTLSNTAGIEIYLEIRLGDKLIYIRIEDCIQTKNGYFLFDSLKMELNDIPRK